MFARMKFINIFITNLAFFILIIRCDGWELATACKDISGQSPELRLKSHLFCDYAPDVQPITKQRNSTLVGIAIMPKFIEYDDLTDTLDVHCWVAMNWTDPHLTWDPSSFDGISNLHVPSFNIWIPDITVHNGGDVDEDSSLPTTGCGLSSDGTVLCLPPVKYSAHCDSDYTNYPYDVQNCTIEVGSWSYTMDEITIEPQPDFIYSDFTPNQDWRVLDMTIQSVTTDYKMNDTFAASMFKMNFVIERREAGVDIVYIIPAVVLMIMTLIVLWLDCHSEERMIVACIGFLCHLLCIQDLYVRIPYNGGVLPTLLKFYETSFLLVAFTLVLTVLLRELRTFTTPAPKWLSSSTSFLLQSKVGQLLLLSILDPKASAFLEVSADDNADLVNTKKNDATWNYVTLLLGWFAFISTFFTYLIMLALYLPRKDTSCYFCVV
ncbi:5-hydroxytryptamine receptor 3A-like [Phymastichus coffea]|uniref:5-hydroxytryptamine receptor 3A-like n=1 Tax=Phymastichus coffea TaxID=108790 RepID=UPI00273B0291|nr:5-hydroxytryptamine receptor 3A-like [Phymastichus coffea]